MRALLFGLFIAGLASAAGAAPRNGYAPYAPIQQPKPPPAASNPGPWKPWTPYKAPSIYGDDPTSLAPSTKPHYAPGVKPFYRSKPSPSGGGTFDRGQGTF